MDGGGFSEVVLTARRRRAWSQVIAPVRSVHRWKGGVETATEARASLRSRRDLVLDRHPYEVPNVTAIPIVDGNPAYLGWIEASTAP